MIDASQRGSHDLEKIIYELKKEIDRLNEEIQALNLQLQKADKANHCVVNDDTHNWGG
jgi:prefoldin subunit 5